MIVFGLTGSIGMGKSKACAMLRHMGIPVHDSDKAAHRALEPGGAAFEMVVLTFRDAWDKKRRIIDRKKLGQIVFSDPQKLQQLEEILHPIVRDSQMKFIRTMKRMGKRAAVLEIPLLFETGAETRVDYVICVSAPYAIQHRRVVKGRQMSEEKFHAILARQMPDAAKRARSDFVVPTGRGYAATYRALRSLLRKTGLSVKGRV